MSQPFSTTHRCSSSMWVEPHCRLMLVPSGRSLMMVQEAPRAVKSLRAVALAEPLAQSMATLSPAAARSSTVERMWAT